LEIVQARLPHTPWSDPALARMPGMRPVEGTWIVVDDAYAAQMAERARLRASCSAAVEAALPGSEDMRAELLEVVLDALPDSFARRLGGVIRPDGQLVATDGPAFAVLNDLLQEDLLLLEKRGDTHVLVAGLLCFPSHWTLSEKIGRPLTRIHAPVPEYDADLGRRVERLFDRIPPGRPLWRANALLHGDAVLHRPRREADPRPVPNAPRYLRSERQTVLRLPRTGAILFAVHTWIVPLTSLTSEQRRGCPSSP
jgi:hypothetical protein